VFIDKGKFNSLKATPCPRSRCQEDLYIKCLELSEQRITSIELFDDINNSDRLVYQTLRNNLINFTTIVIKAPVNELNFKKYCDT
jgi:hypothetical protein